MKPHDFPLPQAVLTALSLLQKAGYEAFVVGGAVRDHLLGLPIHDYDLTTAARPQEIIRVFQAFAIRTQGLSHGTVTVLFPDMPLEITTYRAESSYHDHRHPDHVTFTADLTQDCARRDFTMNAICYHPHLGYIDPFDGIRAIRQKKICTVGAPCRRFEEDALRILRALRFASVYGFTIEDETAQAMYQKRDTLRYIHMERIHDEWTGAMAGARFPDILFAYRDIFTVFLPELARVPDDYPLRKMLHEAKHRHGDADILMALLLSAMQPPSVSAVLSRLKFPAENRRRISDLYALRNAAVATKADLLHILQKAAPILSQFILFYALLHPDCADLEPRFRQLIQDGAVYSLTDLAVNGHDLLDVPPPLRGHLLKTMLEEVIQGRLPNKKADLLAFMRTQIPPDRHS